MATPFEDFVKWNNIYSMSRVSYANIEADRFNPERDRQSAAMVLEQIAKENNDNNDDEIQHVLQQGTKEQVKGVVIQGKAIYEPQIKELFTASFDAFYVAVPQPVKDAVYVSLDLFKPRSDLGSLTGDTLKAAKIHASIAGMKENIIKYQSEQTPQSEKLAIEEEIRVKLAEHYKKVYFDTPEKRARYQGIVDTLNTWAEHSPRIALDRYAKVYHDKKKEFDALVTKDNIQDYLAKAMETDEKRKLFASANRIYEQAQERERVMKNS